MMKIIVKPSGHCLCAALSLIPYVFDEKVLRKVHRTCPKIQ